MHRTTAFRLTWILLAITLAAGCERRLHLVEQHLFEFGTIIKITMITPDLKQAENLLAEVERQLGQQRHQWHAWEESDLTRFNASLQRNAVAEIPASLSRLLELSIYYHRASAGLFNPALGKLIAAYGFHGGDIDPDTINRIGRNIPTMTDLKIENGVASSQHSDLQIDLGGIAKGYAVGLIAAYLDSNGIENYIVNAGGDMSIAGNRFGRPWRIGIQNPFAPGVVASLEVEGRHSLFTSGNYERQSWLGQNRTHHIIDPRTGQPAIGQSSATVLTGDPVLADIAATALMIDGLDQHSHLPAKLGLTNFLVVSDARQLIISQTLADMIEISVNWPTIIIE